MNDAENVAKRVETPMHCMNQSRVEAGKRISPTNTAAAADAATACVEAGRKGGNGGIPLLAVDFASFTFIPERGRTDLGRPGAFAVSLSCSSKQLTNIFFTILVDCCYMVRPRNTSKG